jgi:phosphoribosylformimino-5-aminoimidazole carboxamide ribonucleotide (ProFAR) isomerase
MAWPFFVPHRAYGRATASNTFRDMIVIPSLPLPDDAASARARIDEWQWLGYQRVEISVKARNSVLDTRRLADELLRDTSCPVQMTGNFRSGDDVETAFATGASLVVLGSRAIDDPEWRSTLLGQFPDQLLISTPLRERRVRTRGARAGAWR